MKNFYSYLRQKIFGKSETSEERVKYLNECAKKTLERINQEIDEVGIEGRRQRLDFLSFKASEYTGLQESAEAREARRRENDVYNLFI